MYPAEIVVPMKAELTDNGFDIIIKPNGIGESCSIIGIYCNIDIKGEFSSIIINTDINRFLDKNKILYNELPSIINKLSKIVNIGNIYNRSTSSKFNVIGLGIEIKLKK